MVFTRWIGTEIVNSSKAIVGVTGITVASGNIVLSGANATVDGVNVATFKSGYDTHVGNDNAHHAENHDNTHHTTNYATKAEFDILVSAFNTHVGSDAQHGHDGYIDKSPVTIDSIDYKIEDGHIAEDLT